MLKTNILYNMDCVEGLSQIDTECTDLVVADPPFAINFKGKRGNYNRKESNVIHEYQDIHEDSYFDFTLQWMVEAKRILKPSGAMFVISGWSHLRDILNVAHVLDLSLINMLVWKYNFGVYTKKKFVTSHYEILYLCKKDKLRYFDREAFFLDDEVDGDKKLQYADREDVWDIKRENWSNYRKSATKLPRRLIEKLIGYTSKEGDLVVDPFCGSGQVPFICQEMNRDWISFEISPTTYEFANERITTKQYLIK